MLSGPIDEEATAELCGALMMLDGSSAESVELIVNGSGGSLDACAAVLDVYALMRAPLEVTALGRAEGAIGVLLVAAPGTRQAAPNASISLRVDRSAASGVGSVVQEAEHLRQRSALISATIARRIGAHPAFVEEELKGGQTRDTETALAANFIDAIGRAN